MKSLLLAVLPLLLLGSVFALGDEKVQNVTADQAEALIKEKKELVILDVRTADEFEKGHIHGAKNLDFFADDFSAQLKALDPKKEYLVHCASGGRSGKTIKQLAGSDLTVYHLNGGFSEWQKAGKPVEK